MTRRFALSLLACGAARSAASTPFRLGAARVRITPGEPIWLAGYAARTHPSSGVACDLWAKALAIDDGHGGRAVVVTMDLLRVPVANVAEEIARRYALGRKQVLLNCSHNHSGPTLWEEGAPTALAADEYEKCRRYTGRLSGQLVDVAGAALRDLAPVSLRHGVAEAGFAANRRVATPKGYEIAYNPAGPVDHRVPVVAAVQGDGRLRAVLFGYACHNTTIGAASYQVNADYAGYAQLELERAHPGATALFLQLCAGDQDPHPRGGVEVAEKHGRELAAAVDRALAQNQPLRGRVRTAFETVDLAFAPHTREMFEGRLEDANQAVVRNARLMLREYDAGHPIRTLSYPVQAVRIGGEFAIVALGGEPVVDYALRARNRYPHVVLAGYSNRVKGYIPSRRVLAEGGYEGGDSMIYYGLPGPFAPDVEERIFGAIGRVLDRAK